MRKLGWVVALAIFAVFAIGPAIGAGAPQQEKGADLSWAYPVPDKDAPAVSDDAKPISVPGSTKTYTRAQVSDLSNPPDWFPDEHAPMPQAVQHGNGPDVPACAACHLPNGLGHPESANLAGLPAAYLTEQIGAWQRGQRNNGARMVVIAKAMSDDDSKQASAYFAALKPAPWVKVVEADTVPKTYVDAIFMRLPRSDGGTEPIGKRIIEVPEDVARTQNRDPHSGTIAYVPKGSLANGEKLATTGAGRTMACSICHGDALMGTGDVPRIAGLSPLYIARQLYNFRQGIKPGTHATLMKAPVENLTPDDIVAISAYVASRPVGSAPAITSAKPAAPATAAAPASPAASAAPAGGATLVEQGAALFRSYSCFECHGEHGEGADDGPDLTGTLLNGDEIAAFLQKPSADAKNKGMPSFDAGSPDIPPLVAFVLSLKKKP